MEITSYQMHNVLNCYSKQLSQNRRGDKSVAEKRNGGDGPQRSGSGGKREATLEAISNDIYHKLTDLTSLNSAREEAAPAQDERFNSNPETETPSHKPTEFVFNVIDRLNRKITNQLSVEDSSGFVKRLEMMEKEAVDSKIESWI